MAKSIIKNELEEAIKVTNEVINEGKDVQNLLWELIKYIKDILIYKTSQNLRLYNEQEIEQIKELAEHAEKQTLLKIIYKLSELENEMKWSSQKNLLFQVGIMGMGEITAVPENAKIAVGEETINNSKMQELYTKIAQLQQEIMQIKQQVIHNSGGNVDNIVEKRKNTLPPKTMQKEKQEIVAKNLEGAKPLEQWTEILMQLKQTGKIVLYTNLINAKAYILNDVTVAIEFTKGMTAFVKTMLEVPENMQELENKVSIACGKQMRIKLIDGKDKQKEEKEQEKNAIEVFAKENDLPLNIIE